MVTTIPTLVILAAGKGSRYGGLKQLASIGPGGAALLEYSAYDALRAGFGRVVLIVRRETEPEFRRRLADGMARRVEIDYAYQSLDDLPYGLAPGPERSKPWGTAHAVLSAEPAIEGPFAAVNADDFYGAASFQSLARFLGEPGRPASAMAAVGFEVAKTLSDAGPVARALCEVDGDGYLQKIVELPAVRRRGGDIVYLDHRGDEQSLSGEEPVSMNMWGLDTPIFDELRRSLREFLRRRQHLTGAELLLPDVVRSAIERRRLTVELLRGSETWGGVTYRQDEQAAATLITSLVARGIYPWQLWS